MATTAERRNVLRDLIENGQFPSQSELHQALARRGYLASQPALSRDLRALVRGHAAASHFTLVRTEPGAASAVARAIEADGLPGITGTIAGDDTVLVAASSQAAARRVRARVELLLS